MVGIGLSPAWGAAAGAGNAIPGVLQNLMQQQQTADDMAADALIGSLFQSMVPGATPTPTEGKFSRTPLGAMAALSDTAGQPPPRPQQTVPPGQMPGPQQPQPNVPQNQIIPGSQPIVPQQMQPGQQPAAPTAPVIRSPQNQQQQPGPGGTMLPQHGEGVERFLDYNPEDAQGRAQDQMWAQSQGGQTQWQPPLNPDLAYKGPGSPRQGQGGQQQPSGGQKRMTEDEGASGFGGSSGIGGMSPQEVLQRLGSSPVIQKLPPQMRARVLGKAAMKLIPFMSRQNQQEMNTLIRLMNAQNAENRTELMRQRLDQQQQALDLRVKAETHREILNDAKFKLQQTNTMERLRLAEENLKSAVRSRNQTQIRQAIAGIQALTNSITSAVNAGVDVKDPGRQENDLRQQIKALLQEFKTGIEKDIGDIVGDSLTTAPDTGSSSRPKGDRLPTTSAPAPSP
jgi:hypothetical protein